MKFLKIFGIGLLVICILAVIPVTKEYISLYQIYVGGGSSGGVSYVPPPSSGSDSDIGSDSEDIISPDEPEDEIQPYKGVYHLYDHPYHYIEELVCKDCGALCNYDGLVDWTKYAMWTSFGVSGQCEATERNKIKCVNCGSNKVKSNDFYDFYHCYIDGVCHDCGRVCDHYIFCSGYNGFNATKSFVSEKFPNHPFVTSDVEFKDGDKCVVDGTCLICLQSDLDFNIVNFYQDGISYIHYPGKLGYEILSVDRNFTDLVIPSVFKGEPVVKICNFAFNGFNVNSITIPEGAVIEENAFVGCNGLQEIILEGERTDEELSKAPWGASEDVNILYMSLDGYIFEKGLTVAEYYLVGYTGSDLHLILPSEFYGAPVVGINSNAFTNAIVERIDIPSSVTYINDNAFNGCVGLEYIVIYGADNTTISSNAFSGCEDLKKISIHRETTCPDEEYYPWGAPEGCSIHYISGGIIPSPDDSWT